MTKGELMKLVYTKDELRNIDTGIPREIYTQPGFSSYCHVMNYNEPYYMGKLQNMFEIADQRDIEIPGLTPEEMTVIINIQMIQSNIGAKEWPLWKFRHLTLEELRELQDEMIIKYNNYLKTRTNDCN